MILPTPPTDHQKYQYTDQNKWLLYGWGLFSFLLLTIGMVKFSTSHHYFWIYTIISTFYLSLSYYVGLFGKSFDLSEHESIKTTFKEYKPTVDVYLPSCGEDLSVLENTYKHVRALKWPEGKIHAYVLDDSDRGSVRILADRFEFDYVCRPDRGVLKKAGNIRHAFPRTSGEFILILDADFCPRPDFLTETIPHFAHDEKLAIVQTPQYFEIKDEQTWVEKGAAYVQELFYRVVQVNRNTWGASVCVGTCAVYRRSALSPHGGTYPIAYSEDLHTGWQCLVDGWKVKYLPINLSKGVCPDTMASYWIQQTRWCTGSTSLLTSKKFWTNKLSLMQRLCYMSGMLYYVATALSLLLTPLPALVMVWFFPEHVFWFNYLYSLPSFIFGVFIIAIWGKAPFGSYVLSARQVSYYAHLFALWDRFRGSIIAWVPTGNASEIKGHKRYQSFKTFMFTWVSIATFLAISGAAYRVHDMEVYNFIPVVFFALFHYWVSFKALYSEA
jgi:cellulose synthase/poly-beta-1,6-N-acetylglucosamine synthase-like glycosyltransferase